ncbi:MAG: glycosyltransferase [bacterium]|nr:glycosyltransferase [bacterium]
MHIGVVIPGFSSDAHDPAIPVQLNLAREQAQHLDYQVIALRYPHRRDQYSVYGAQVYSLGYGAWTHGIRRLVLWRDALAALEQLHRAKPFNVLHAMWADEAGLIAGWFGQRHRIPVVVSILGGELAHIPSIGYGGQLSRYGRWVTGQALSRAARIHVVSGYVREKLRASSYHLDQDQWVTVPLGVDTMLFHPANTPHAADHLVCVASLIPVKDHALLLHTVARLPHVTLDLIGDGPLRSALESLARALGIRERVRFRGSLPHAQLADEYRRAALHVLTSHHETFAVCVAEAAACGTPSVTTAVGMLPDYPSVGVNVPSRDPDALAAAIDGLLTDGDRLQALRQTAYETAHTHLTIQATAAQLRGLYHAMCA